MNTNNNTYTIIYSAILVIIVAAVLAYASNALKGTQEKNKIIEKKMNILMSVHKAMDALKTSNKDKYIETEYEKYIIDEFFVNKKGERIEGKAFDVNIKDEMGKPENDRLLPVFVCNDNNELSYIVPVQGPGLWGAIWGYISLKNDFNTIYGAIFDHAGETPGLGAEIASVDFQQQFNEKKIYDGDKFTSVNVIKKDSAPLTEHSVDGISGGTITSKAVSAMIFNCLSIYGSFFEKQRQIQKQNKAIETIKAETVDNDSIR
jgi:Na+-transporting NADH:ubiquinone oxidoreductase subunit C